MVTMRKLVTLRYSAYKRCPVNTFDVSRFGHAVLRRVNSTVQQANRHCRTPWRKTSWKWLKSECTHNYGEVVRSAGNNNNNINNIH